MRLLLFGLLAVTACGGSSSPPPQPDAALLEVRRVGLELQMSVLRSERVRCVLGDLEGCNALKHEEMKLYDEYRGVCEQGDPIVTHANAVTQQRIKEEACRMVKRYDAFHRFDEPGVIEAQPR